MSSLIDVADAELIVKVALACILVSVLVALYQLGKRSPDAQARSWSLADALSENVTLSSSTGVPVTVLVASSSRLIAFLGLVVSLAVYVCIGLALLFALLTGKDVSKVVDTLWQVLAGGVGMFLPYLANQAREALKKEAPVGGKSTPADEVLKQPDGTPRNDTQPLPVPKGPAV
jgi:hypothetical protein